MGLTQLANRPPDQQSWNSLLRIIQQHNQRLLTAFQQMLGNCAQELAHRGPVNFFDVVQFFDQVTFQDIRIEGDIIIDGEGPGEAKILRLATATDDWTNVAGVGKKSYVACTDNESSEAVNVYLPRNGDGDPNVRSGDVLAYLLDMDGDAVCVSAYMDAKIGTVWMWAGAAASIPRGWAVCDGLDGTVNMQGRKPVGFQSGHPIYGVSIGSPVTNDETHIHAPHIIADEIPPHAAGETGFNLSALTSYETVIVSVSDVVLQTECSATGITINTIGSAITPNPHNHAITATTQDIQTGSSSTVTVVTEVTATQFTTLIANFIGSVTEPACTSDPGTSVGHCHQIPVHSHTAAGLPHAHTVYPHKHPLPELTHSGSMEHSREYHLDPAAVVFFIQRIN